MKIVIFANPENDQAFRQIHILRKTVPYPAQVVTSHEAFVQAYTQCLSGETIIVFFVGSDDDLAFLESMQEKFLDTKLLLSISDDDARRVARAYRLHPRLLVSLDDAPTLLCMTLLGIVRVMNAEHRMTAGRKTCVQERSSTEKDGLIG